MTSQECDRIRAIVERIMNGTDERAKKALQYYADEVVFGMEVRAALAPYWEKKKNQKQELAANGSIS